MKKRVIITTGGTGGHLYPAQALAQELMAVSPSIELLFAGGHLSTTPFFDQQRFLFKDIECSSLPYRPLSCLKSLWKICKGVGQSLKMIKQFRPELIIGFGSYHTIPTLIAARLCQVPFALHEANSLPGKANRWMAPHATFVGVNFLTAKKFLKGNVVEVALPVRKTQVVDKQSALDYYCLKDYRTTILIFGGSQGAASINEVMKKILPALKGLPLQFIHFTGQQKEIKTLSALYARYQFPACVKDFEKKMEYGWKAADFVISRAGASTIAEAIENEVPAILIPYPYATENHQQKNADFFTAEVQGGAQLMENSSLEETLFQEIKKMVEQDLILKRKKAICFYKTVPKKTLCQLVLDQLIDGGGSP